MTEIEATRKPSELPGTETAETRDEDIGQHWLVRDPIRSAALLITLLALAARTSVLKDSFFITDDFMLSSRAMENDFGWAYLTRVHTGHFEPIGFATMWVLAHFAPLDWGWTVVTMVVAQLTLAYLVWTLLTELFGRRPLVLVPYGLFAITPLTMPAFTWLAAAIIWLPLMMAMAGALRWHTRYVRTGRPLHALAATGFFVMGLCSFEKIVVFVPFVVAFTFAVSPTTPVTLRGAWNLFVRTKWIWAGYIAAGLAYLAIYVPGVRSLGNESPVTAPTLGPLSDFAFLSVFRTFIPGAFGGPWDWQPTSYALAIVDSPRAFDWAMWIIALACVVASLVVRRNVGRFWAALLVYLAGSIATVAAGRVAFGGSIVALETRYLADAVIPLLIAVGASLLPLKGEAQPWTSTGRRLFARTPQWSGVGALALMALVVVSLSLHAIGSYARFSGNNPARAFVTNTLASLGTLPATAEIYDTEVPGAIIGPLFAQYNLASRYLAPMVGDDRLETLYTQRTFRDPYVLSPSGALVPMRINVVSTSPAVPNSCHAVRDGVVVVPLTAPVYEWGWAVRLGYLTDGDATATVSLGKDSQVITVHKGLGEVYVSLVGSGKELRITDLPVDVNFCVGDAQVGFPTAGG